MLLEIRIENFILIKELNIAFSDHLNIFSGETGAGKSMIFGALNVGLGEKANGDCVRSGSNKAIVQLVFDVSDPVVLKILEKFEIELEDGMLIITREVHTSGRTVIRINDRIYTLGALREITAHLIDIHGQHAHQSLLYPKNHIDLLDLMGDTSHADIKKSVKDSHTSIKEIQNEINRISNRNDGDIDVNYLKYQINEIDSLNITEEDENGLEEKYSYYKNIESIQTAVQSALAIVSGSHESSGLKELAGLAINSIDSVVSYDSKVEPILSNLNNVFYNLEDINTDLRQYLDNIDIDEEEFYVIEQRMNSINELKLKYGKSIDLILKKRESLKEQLSISESKDKMLEDLENKLQEEKLKFKKIALELSNKRNKLSAEFSNEVVKQLKMLNMPNSDFAVNLETDDELCTQNGIDKAEFIISTNPGMPLKPLAKIASGGEISRVMLAIKIALASVDQMESLVFDEVDTGISGSTAITVGEKLSEISRFYQVICITHLPQIAIMADAHFLISKNINDSSASTNVTKLTTDTQSAEIARMLSGDTNDHKSLENAKDMLKRANRYIN